MKPLSHKEIDDTLNLTLVLLINEENRLKALWWMSAEEKERLEFVKQKLDESTFLWARHNGIDPETRLSEAEKIAADIAELIKKLENNSNEEPS